MSEKTAAELIEQMREWMLLWDDVCAAADPDDGHLPEWREVFDKVLKPKGWEDISSAEYFEGYWSATLHYMVRDLLHATPKQEPTP